MPQVPAQLFRARIPTLFYNNLRVRYMEIYGEICVSHLACHTVLAVQDDYTILVLTTSSAPPATWEFAFRHLKDN